MDERKKQEFNQPPAKKPERKRYELDTPELPVLAAKTEIKETFRHNTTFLIIGETGSGKTTQVPQILLDASPPGTKIVVTQPRRVAAISVAKFVSLQRQCKIGEEIGYQIRFDDHTSEGTRLNFVTDGIILRQLQIDPLLQEYDVVMVDEAHERSLNIDFLLGLLKRTQYLRQARGLPPLKIIISSATLEKEKFQHYFAGAPLIEVSGRLHPIEIHYCPEYEETPTEGIIPTVQHIIEQQLEGDILIFMPGEAEIDYTIRKLESAQKNNLFSENLEFLPLFARLSPEDQDRIFQPSNKRRIIVATNIAETSVTIPGIRHVIDSGLIKQNEFDPQTGITALKITHHSKSGCSQRAGRAGRLSSGHCWRLYSEENFAARLEHTKPEIQRSDLAHIVLAMRKMGLSLEEVHNFDFIDPPAKTNLDEAIETLILLGALTQNGDLTKEGELMAEMPLEPRLARMIIEAEKYGCVLEVCTVAAFLSASRPVFTIPKSDAEKQAAEEKHRQFRNQDSDFLTLLSVWQAYQRKKQEAGNRNNGLKEWCRENFLRINILEEVGEIRQQLLQILRRNGYHHQEQTESPENIAKAISAGLIANLMISDAGYSYIRAVDGQGGFFIHPSSGIFGTWKPKLLVAAKIMRTTTRTTKSYLHFCQTLQPEWLRDIAPQWVEERRRTIEYDKQNDEAREKVDLFFVPPAGDFDIQIMTEYRPVSSAEAAEALASAIVLGSVEMPDPLQEIHQNNLKLLERIKNLWIKNEGEL